MVRASRFTLVSEADLAPNRSTEMRQQPTKAHNCAKLPYARGASLPFLAQNRHAMAG
jgi:hypothetical protein